jgi:hypothetical protein
LEGQGFGDGLVCLCASLVASVTSVALFIYWRRDKAARRPYRDASSAALGVMWGLIALDRYLGHAGPGWMVWLCALAALASPISIWEARRKDARDEARHARDPH